MAAGEGGEGCGMGRGRSWGAGGDVGRRAGPAGKNKYVRKTGSEEPERDKKMQSGRRRGRGQRKKKVLKVTARGLAQPSVLPDGDRSSDSDLMPRVGAVVRAESSSHLLPAFQHGPCPDADRRPPSQTRPPTATKPTLAPGNGFFQRLLSTKQAELPLTQLAFCLGHGE